MILVAWKQALFTGCISWPRLTLLWVRKSSTARRLAVILQECRRQVNDERAGSTQLDRPMLLPPKQHAKQFRCSAGGAVRCKVTRFGLAATWITGAFGCAKGLPPHLARLLLEADTMTDIAPMK
jgi:hypothetical protein